MGALCGTGGVSLVGGIGGFVELESSSSAAVSSASNRLLRTLDMMNERLSYTG